MKDTKRESKKRILRDIIKISGIYKIINKINGKYYVGSSKDIWHRWFSEHKCCLRYDNHDNTHLQRSWNKHGENNFEFIIVEDGIPYNQLLLIEQKYLDIAKTEKHTCYNQSFIAGRIEMTEEVRNKISKANTGKIKKFTQGGLLAQIQSGIRLQKWLKNPENKKYHEEKRILGLKGSKKSDHWKKLMSEKMTGRIYKEKWRKNLSLSQKGKPKPPRTKEHQEKLSQSHRGQKRSEEAREKMRISRLNYINSHPKI